MFLVEVPQQAGNQERAVGMLTPGSFQITPLKQNRVDLVGHPAPYDWSMIMPSTRTLEFTCLQSCSQEVLDEPHGKR